MVCANMILVVEGVSCGGKTTLIEALHNRIVGSVVVDPRFGRDHHDAFRQPPSAISEELHALHTVLRMPQSKDVADELDCQEKYLPLVKARLSLIAGASRHAPWVLAHRDITSNFVQGDVRFRGQFGPGRGAFADLFEQLWRGLPPREFADLHVFIKIPWKVFVERTAMRRRPTWQSLQDEGYFISLSHSYDTVAAALGKRCLLLDGERPIDEIVSTTISWLNKFSWPPRPVEETCSILELLTSRLRGLEISPKEIR